MSHVFLALPGECWGERGCDDQLNPGLDMIDGDLAIAPRWLANAVLRRPGCWFEVRLLMLWVTAARQAFRLSAGLMNATQVSASPCISTMRSPQQGE